MLGYFLAIVLIRGCNNQGPIYEQYLDFFTISDNNRQAIPMPRAGRRERCASLPGFTFFAQFMFGEFYIWQ